MFPYFDCFCLLIQFQFFTDHSQKYFSLKWSWMRAHCDMCRYVIITRRAFCIHNSPYVLILALIGSDSLFCDRGTSPTCEWMIYVTICFVLIIIWLSLFLWWLSMSRSIWLRARMHACTHSACTHPSHVHAHTPTHTHTHTHTCATQLWNNWAASRSLPQTHSPHSHPSFF